TNFWFGTALENMTHGLSMFDPSKRLVVCNQRYATMYRLPAAITQRGTPHDQIIRQGVRNVMFESGTRGQAAEQKLISLLTMDMTEKSSRVDELADGRLIEVTCQPMAGGGWVSTHEDVTDQKRAERKISHLAHHDGLTGVANRFSFISKLEDAAARLRATRETFSIFVLDLDRFKIINDTMGHPIGDKLLLKVVERLRSNLEERDVLGRLGGDEFAIIQAGEIDQRGAATRLANRIVETMLLPFELDGNEVTVGTSIGIVLAPEHASDPDTLLKM